MAEFSLNSVSLCLVAQTKQIYLKRSTDWLSSIVKKLLKSFCLSVNVPLYQKNENRYWSGKVFKMVAPVMGIKQTSMVTCSATVYLCPNAYRRIWWNFRETDYHYHNTNT